MNAETIHAVWDAAIADCVNGHGDCTYGGWSIGNGYWLVTEDCDRNHGENCVWCAAEATGMFHGRVGEPLVGELYGIPSCAPCGAAWVSLNPGQWQAS